MDVAEIDERITGLEDSVARRVAKMEDVMARFVSATESFAAEWYRKTVQQAVSDAYAKVNERTGEGLDALKADLEDAILRVPELVRERLDNDKLWDHRSERKSVSTGVTGTYGPQGRGDEPSLNAAIRGTLSPVGALLRKHGLLGDKTTSNWKGGPTGTLVFPYGFDFSPEMKPILEEYSEDDRQLRHYRQELSELREAKGRAEALQRWEAA